MRKVSQINSHLADLRQRTDEALERDDDGLAILVIFGGSIVLGIVTLVLLVIL